MNRHRILIIVGIAAVLAAAIGWYRTDAAHKPAARTSQGSRGAAVPVTTTPAQAEDFAIRRRTIGIMESPATVVVKSRLESQVTEQHVRDGQLVKKGDVLFTLDDRVVKAVISRDQAQLEKDQASADRTELDLERYQRLSETNATSRQQLDQATADHKIALAVVEADKAQVSADNLQLGYTKIEAPIGGRLGTVRVSPGNLVSVNDPTGLVTITQVRPIRIAFTLPERDLAALRKAYITKPPGGGARLRAGRQRCAGDRRTRLHRQPGRFHRLARSPPRPSSPTKSSSSGRECTSTSRSISRSGRRP